MAQCSLPIVAIVTESSGSLQIINIDEVNPFVLQLPPYPIACTDWPSRLIPVSQHNALCMRSGYLRSEKSQLGIIERCPRHRPEIGCEVCRRNGRDEGGDIGKGAVEGWDRRIVEVETRRDGLDLVQRSVARADDGDGAQSELVR